MKPFVAASLALFALVLWSCRAVERSKLGYYLRAIRDDQEGAEGIGISSRACKVAARCIMAAIFGSGEPFDAATLRRLYPGGRTEYVGRFTASLDTAIQSGFILPADRAEIIDIACASCPASVESD